MANILLVDPDEVAFRALSGILSRDNHRCVAVGTAAEAWEFIRHNIKIDLLIVELKLREESGLTLIQRLKHDPCLKLMPIVVYTGQGNRDNVRNALALRVQNVLIKPYHDDTIFTEITKATAAHWHKPHFQDAETFCRVTGNTAVSLQNKLNELSKTLELARVSLIEKLDSQDAQHIVDDNTVVTIRMDSQGAQSIIDELVSLTDKAEECGAWGATAYINHLIEKARAAHWTEFKHDLDNLDFCSRLIFHHLNEGLIPEGFQSPEEMNADIEGRERARWTTAAEQKNYPVIQWVQLQREIESLSGCPVIDSAAAAFQMSANGRPTSLKPLMDMVDKDPGLTAQILIAVRRLRRSKSSSDGGIEEARMAIGMLGELRLSGLGHTLIPARERAMLVPPVASWPQYWMFLLGTARLAEYACIHMEFNHLETVVYTAGLLHDLGKLILLRLHPLAFQSIFAYARQHNKPMYSAEKLHLGATTQEIAAHFADYHELPKRFANVMRWVESPEMAVEDSELVAVVALARHLCRRNQIGFSGNTPEEEIIALEHTAAWRVLEGRVFPSFNLKKFEAQVRNECRHLKRELQGRVTHYTVA